MELANATVVPLHHGMTLDIFGQRLCRELGNGYCVERVPGAADQLLLKTPELGELILRRQRDEVTVEASGWPVVDGFGRRRRFARQIDARVSLHRDPEALALDIERRVLRPYREALADARRRSTAYRQLLDDIADCLQLAGLRRSDVHGTGRQLQAQMPLEPLDDARTRMPSRSTSTITLHEDRALGSFEVHYLSLRELASLNRFVARMIARRQPAFRLQA